MPAYAEGQIARIEVTAPVALEVVNPEKTQRLRQEAAAKVPMIYRFEAAAALEAEAGVREAFSGMKDRFLQAMHQAARRPKLDQPTVQHPSFFRFMDWFREQHPGFPLTTNLARIWGLHEPDDPIQTKWIGSLREVMNQCIVPEQTDPAGEARLDLVRVVSAPARGGALTWKMVDSDGITLRSSDLLRLSQAGSRLRAALSDEPEEVGSFLAGFLKANCFPEEELTQAIRLQAVAGVLAVDHYEAGQIIVRRGEPVAGGAKAALDLLRAQKEISTQPGSGRAGSSGRFWPRLHQSWKRAVLDPLGLENAAWRGLCLAAAVSLCGTGVLAWLVRRRRLRRPLFPPPQVRDATYTVVLNPQRNETVFLPTNPPPGTIKPGQDETASEGGDPAESMVSLSDRFWQERARQAERRAEEILAMVRAGLAPQLARQMMHALVRELISQRTRWLQTQRVAEEDLTEIERRFSQAHGELVDRLRAFEQRTEHLEKALAVKAEENSELIKAHIALTQKQLETKETGAWKIWN